MEFNPSKPKTIRSRWTAFLVWRKTRQCSLKVRQHRATRTEKKAGIIIETEISYIICDRLWENPAYGIFCESWVWSMVDKLYHRANPGSAFRLIVHFVVEIQRFVCNHATPLKNREIAVQRRCYACVWRFHILHVNWKSIKWTWVELFKMNIKNEQGLNFVIGNDSRLFFNAQEAKKVSKHTVARWI